MEITVEYLKERLGELRAQRDDALKQLGATEGAIQTVEFLINELKEGGGEIPPPKEQDHGG